MATAPNRSEAAAARRPTRARMSLEEAMSALAAAGSEQTRRTYARHGAAGPMFGVSFATLKALTKRIDVDHPLACSLWETGNLDARNLAVKIVDPGQLTSADLDRWAHAESVRQVCGGYCAMLAAETPFGAVKAVQWLAAADVAARVAGWTLLAQLALRDEAATDAEFLARLGQIERTIHAAPNPEREVMNLAIISLGCRSPTLRDAAVAAAQRIGNVKIDHGDTACKTPAAAEYIRKTWAHSTAKGFATPAAHERTRDWPRRRC